MARMILITGGLGFLGSHTARALLDQGEDCLLTQRRSIDLPSYLRDEPGSRLAVAPVDVTDRSAVVALGDRYHITGVIHLAAGWPSNPFDEVRDNASALANVAEAATLWKVKRIAIASTIGVYGGSAIGALAVEDTILPHTGNRHPIPALKKAAEMFAEQVEARAGLECVVLRIAGLYGPRYRGMRTFISRVVHAAAHRRPADLTGVAFGGGPDDGGDWCYVGDVGRGIALLQTTATLRHRTYNVGSGKATRNRDVVAAVAEAAASPVLGLPDTFATPQSHATGAFALDITRIADDTGFRPAISLTAGVAQYVDWLRSGNEF
jgi:UDP-glucose 4-epimerase